MGIYERFVELSAILLCSGFRWAERKQYRIMSVPTPTRALLLSFEVIALRRNSTVLLQQLSAIHEHFPLYPDLGKFWPDDSLLALSSDRTEISSTASRG